MICECGAEVEADALVACVAQQIDEGEVIESVLCSACPKCADLDGSGYIFQVVVT